MHKMNYFLKLIVFATLATQISVHCSTPSEGIKGVSRKTFTNNSHNRSTPNASLTHTSEHPHDRVTAKKWQVGRVSRKHYEIVNMLWRKTKIFTNMDTPDTTTKETQYRRNKPILTKGTKSPLAFTPVWFNAQSYTPSYMEFYYLDDNDERIKRRDFLNPNSRSKITKRKPLTNDNNANLRRPGFRYPFLSFYVSEPKLMLVTPSPTKSRSPKVYDQPQIRKKVIREKQAIHDFLNRLNTVKRHKHRSINKMYITLKSISEETCPITNESTEDNVTSLVTETHNVRREVTSSTSTKAYDKIKFFEMYDKNTHLPGEIKNEYDNLNNMFIRNEENLVKENYIDSNQQASLEDVDKNIGHHDGLNQKYIKKHIENDDTKEIISDPNNHKMENNMNFKPVTFHKNKTEEDSNIDLQKVLNKESFSVANKGIFPNSTLKTSKNASMPALWADYPFAAVYVYEPSHIHCDAAALSPHWLIAAGACLSRYHRKDPMTEGRSAFVAYCGENWWHPERVSYVKYSIVHPRYNPKDKLRRYLYNIGLIQVVGSMASACFGWRPISLISHHYASSLDGSLASAVGWGLDRYDVRFMLTDLPKVPLSVYEELVFSTSCPGSTGYSKMKMQNEETAIKNIYCLLLAPYNGEDNDPIHGSMLLVGGKLIALYIQVGRIVFYFPFYLKEERRTWGQQSAQYTGIWRLVPWVHEVARESEDSDSFNIDI